MYTGIAIISKKEFFIEIFRTKTKFYISAIELSKKTPYMIELYINQGKKLLKESDDNFDNLVMRLEFKFGKLTIKDMNKILYEDFTEFATTPRDRTITTSNLSSLSKSRKSSYNPYYKHKKTPNSLLNKSQPKVALKPNFRLKPDSN